MLAACFSLPGGVLRAVGGWLSDKYGAHSVTWWVMWVDRARLRAGATVALAAAHDDARCPLLAGWREGAARVVCWFGDLRAVTTDDEAAARWWAAVLAACDGL